jgi:xylobiose transport system substrate-binding protein
MRHHSRWMRGAGCLFATAVLAMAATGCKGSDSKNSGSSGSSGPVQVWALQDPSNQPIIQAGIDAYGKSGKSKLELQTFTNDAYKQKLQVSMGSPNAPDVFFNWGGGNLAQYVKAGQVADLTDALAKNSEAANAFLPSVLDVGKVDGKQYGLPMNGIQPVVMFYNKKVFADAGLQPPKTYDDLLGAVDKFKAKGVIPIALAGSQGWTELMYLESLLDRVGGPAKFADIVAGKDGAWKDPAVIKSLTMCQELAKRGAFGSNFSSINYDNTGSSKLLATGKAAMHLMGAWDYPSQVNNNPDFVKAGNLGWFAFPSVTGGAGDAKSVVGNPSNYFSVRSGGKNTEAAVDFVIKTLSSAAYTDDLIKAGQVPAVKGVDAKLANSPNTDFAVWTYQLVSNAPSFTQSWDQALSPAAGTELNANMQKLLLSQLTPDAFADAMAKVK